MNETLGGKVEVAGQRLDEFDRALELASMGAGYQVQRLWEGNVADYCRERQLLLNIERISGDRLWLRIHRGEILAGSEKVIGLPSGIVIELLPPPTQSFIGKVISGVRRFTFRISGDQ